LPVQPCQRAPYDKRGQRAGRAKQGKLSKATLLFLRFAAAAEIIEADLWQQYTNWEDPRRQSGYMAALSNLDGDMAQYISDNTDDD